MTITVKATYQDGVLKPTEPLPLNENQRINITIHASPRGAHSGYGLIPWTGTLDDLDYLIEAPENAPLEGP